MSIQYGIGAVFGVVPLQRMECLPDGNCHIELRAGEWGKLHCWKDGWYQLFGIQIVDGKWFPMGPCDPCMPALQLLPNPTHPIIGRDGK